MQHHAAAPSNIFGCTSRLYSSTDQGELDRD